MMMKNHKVEMNTRLQITALPASDNFIVFLYYNFLTILP